MVSGGGSGDIVPLARYQVDRPTVDYPSESIGREPPGSAMPTNIGRYIVLELLGVGGMGVVCTAYDPKLDRKVALKLLRRKKSDREGRVTTGQARLIREAQALAKLNHPNIVTVHDVDTYEGQIYMAMEYVDGWSLDRWMAKKQQPWRDVVRVFIDAARGLAAAHEAGIIHRDFKPGNVLLAKDDRVLVLDFGLAKNHDHVEKNEPRPDISSLSAADIRERTDLLDAIGSTLDTKLTQAGRTVGTPAYMAPEQFLGLPVVPQTDQFSLGVALYEALYHHLPFPDESRDELIDRVTEGKIVDPPRDTDVPSWVHRVVLRTLQKRPADRFASVDELIAALQADPAKRRRRMLGWGGGTLLLGFAAYGAVQGLLPDDEVCRGADARVAQIWGVEQQDRIEEAFEATERPFAADAWEGVRRALDARTQEWASAHTDICEATNVSRDQSAQLMDARMACLDRRHVEMRALMEVFVEADATVVRQAIEATQSLENIDDCRTLTDDGSAAVLADPERRRQADQVESWLVKSRTLSLAGKNEEASQFSANAMAVAKQLGHRPLLARATIQQARISAQGSVEPLQAEPQIIAAIELASATEQPALEAEAWSLLISMRGNQSGGLDHALALRLPVELALAKANDMGARAAYDRALGSVLSNNGRREEGIESMLRALKGYQSLYSNDHTSIAAVLSNLGGQYTQLGEEERARYYLGEALRSVKRIHGPHHPLVGPILINLAGVEQQVGNIEAALEAYLEAEAVLRDAMPPGHPHVLVAMLGSAQAQATVDSDPKLATRRFNDLVSVIQAQAKPDMVTLASVYNSLGRLQQRQAMQAQEANDLSRVEPLQRKAEESFVAALEAYEELGGSRTRMGEMTLVHRNYCTLEIDRGRSESAHEQCNLAWELERDAEQIGRIGVNAVIVNARLYADEGNFTAELRLLREAVKLTPMKFSVPVRLALAERLWEQPAARREATSIVQAAKASLGQGSSGARDAIEAWLHEHQQ